MPEMEDDAPDAAEGSILAFGEVHVWRVSADCLSTTADWELLSQEERHRALAFRFPRDRVRWIRAHAALRGVLRNYVGDGPPLRFRLGRFGKPELEESSGLRFNLAHSGQWALIAVARDRDVGIDVEEVSLDDIAPVLPTTFSRVERAALAGLSGRARIEAFYRGWARKEAFVKALGLGLRADLTAFEVFVDAPLSRLVSLRAPFRDSHWMLADVTLDSRHKAALVVEGTGPVECRFLDWRGPTQAQGLSSEGLRRQR